MITHHLKDIQTSFERAITPFHIFDLDQDTLEPYSTPHTKDHFCLMFIEKGKMNMQVEDRRYQISENSISVIFPGQLSSKEQVSSNIRGKMILFDEVLFCSDILRNELRIYNYDISTKLNYIALPTKESDDVQIILKQIESLYSDLTSVKKEQARFYIKILLLKLVEYVHTNVNSESLRNDNTKLYAHFLEVLERNFKTERAVSYYADKLQISTKKLNQITKQLAGLTAIETIHSRIMNEIKQLLLLSTYSHKEIAFELGFNSPAALNKFVRAKLGETPTELQHQLLLMYNT